MDEWRSNSPGHRVALYWIDADLEFGSPLGVRAGFFSISSAHLHRERGYKRRLNLAYFSIPWSAGRGRRGSLRVVASMMPLRTFMDHSPLALPPPQWRCYADWEKVELEEVGWTLRSSPQPLCSNQWRGHCPPGPSVDQSGPLQVATEFQKVIN